jgi:Uma2 family endonuclease
MATKAEDIYLSEESYLASELLSEVKREYINGSVYAMTGTAKNHQRININLSSTLWQHLTGKPCDVYSSDMKVKAGKNFFYPDVMVVCNDTTQHEYYTESPLLIVEVLSKSTRKTDKGLKRLAYQSLPRLQEYVLIEQDFVEVEICRRSRYWQSEYYFLGDNVYFESIDFKLSVEDIYARVENLDMVEYIQLKEKAKLTRVDVNNNG